MHRLLNRGHREVVDADLSNYFGEIRMLGWIKAWLEMPMEEDEGGMRRTNRARRERKGAPQGAPISPLFSNVCQLSHYTGR